MIYEVRYRIQNFFNNIIESYPMKSVFEYLEYRDFLKDFYEEKKSECSFFSYRLFGTTV
jgi:hypothetical protein